MQAALSGGTTDLETMNLNLSGAYRLNNAWSFGLGFNAVYARAKIERFAGDLGAVGCWSDYAISLPGKLLKGKHWQLPPTVSTVIPKSLI